MLLMQQNRIASLERDLRKTNQTAQSMQSEAAMAAALSDELKQLKDEMAATQATLAFKVR
jgi:hypothetical protein